MIHDQGPKDGDFARYVEGLSRNPVVPSVPSQATDLPDFQNRNASGTSEDAPYQTEIKSPKAAARSVQMDLKKNVSADLKAAVAGIAVIVRTVLLAFVALFILAPLIPEPFDSFVRLAAIVYAAYVIKRNQSAFGLMRDKLNQLKKTRS